MAYPSLKINDSLKNADALKVQAYKKPKELAALPPHGQGGMPYIRMHNIGAFLKTPHRKGK